MSDTDSFIEEVTEEVRRDQLFAMFRKYGWIAVLAVVLLVGGAAWKEWQAARVRAAAEAFGDSVLAAQDANDAAAREKALSAVAAKGGQAAVVDLLTATAAQDAGDSKTALAKLDAVAADDTLPIAYRDLAVLKKVLIAGDEMQPDARKAALEPLSQPGRPYRPLALEQIALLAVAAGDSKSAIDQFNEILQDSDVTPGLRRRATQMIVALGGTPEAS
ncbi:tetratricopeptide repeat protein [Acidimangrovimonas pyrenivorans]|uniref:Tetratricopeptide repeat protein n=1 Tax=Acidimangrovimonas pyrenivorans TaxID=2030798 RepID=A0ABV7AJV5_9RHOB